MVRVRNDVHLGLFRPASNRFVDSEVAMSTCKHGQLARSCGTCELERENATLTARVTQLEQQIELNRAVLAGARNCILMYVPVSIQSDRDFTLGSIKLALDR